MIEFSPRTPYPLLEMGTYSYGQAQEHAVHVDKWLGIDTEKVENALQEDDDIIEITSDPRQEVWIGLHVPALLTPYAEIRTILATLDLKPKQLVVDLGSGYGRMAFVMGWHYPEVQFLGYELLAGRVNETQRCLARFRYSNVRIEKADLIADDFCPVAADFYFLYDFGSREAIEKTLQDLKIHARKKPITVVARGRSSRDIIDRMHPWLSKVVPPVHHLHFSIYRSGLN